MNTLDALDLIKNNAQTNQRDWIKETSFISYGIVTDIVSDGIVTITGIVRNGTAVKTLTVPIITFSSRLAEDSAAPQEGDLVLLLFLDKTDTGMFDNAKARFAATGDWSIFNRYTTGYDKFSAVGILMQPFKGVSSTVHRHTTGPDGVASYMFKTNATYQGVFRREFNLMFDALPGDSGFVDRLCRVTFGQHSPFIEDHWAAVTRMYGFSIMPDETLAAVVAPVKEYYSQYATLERNMQADVTENYGLAFSPAGDLDATSYTELVATVLKRYHGKVTLNLDYRGPTNISFGIGNAETGSPTADRNSPVTAQFGSLASLTITSKSFFSATFQGAITLKTTTNNLIKIANSVNSLGVLIDTLVNALNTGPLILVTGAAGGPSPVNPAVTAALNAFKTQWDLVFN